MASTLRDIYRIDYIYVPYDIRKGTLFNKLEYKSIHLTVPPDYYNFKVVMDEWVRFDKKDLPPDERVGNWILTGSTKVGKTKGFLVDNYLVRVNIQSRQSSYFKGMSAKPSSY